MKNIYNYNNFITSLNEAKEDTTFAKILEQDVSQEELDLLVQEHLNMFLENQPLLEDKEWINKTQKWFLSIFKTVLNKAKKYAKKAINILKSILKAILKFAKKYPKLTKIMIILLVIVVLIIVSAQTAVASNPNDTIELYNAAIGFLTEVQNVGGTAGPFGSTGFNIEGFGDFHLSELLDAKGMLVQFKQQVINNLNSDFDPNIITDNAKNLTQYVVDHVQKLDNSEFHTQKMQYYNFVDVGKNYIDAVFPKDGAEPIFRIK